MSLFLGSEPSERVRILGPSAGDSSSYDQGKLLILSLLKEAGPDLLVSTQWSVQRVMDVSTRGAKDNFAKDFYRIFEPKTTMQQLTYALKYFKGFSKPESLTYAFRDTMSIRTFWQKPEFTSLVKSIRSTDVSEVLVTLKGWRDSVWTTPYDDPNSDSRSLFKLHVQLVPGVNRIFFSTPGRKDQGVEYYTNYVDEAKPVESRSDRFHNSRLEESCTSCHEGLPSANEGKSMKADCAVCHKAKFSATFLHGPAEMKECTSCHSWSAEKKAIVVEKGVPAACYDCHDKKQAQVESSQFPHPVAGECLTCHSPHGTEQKHLVKEDVYTLCTSCHEDQKINHPVGRHPLRFVTLNNGQELSCVTCHNPHGSENEKLFTFPGGRLEVCSQCH